MPAVEHVLPRFVLHINTCIARALRKAFAPLAVAETTFDAGEPPGFAPSPMARQSEHAGWDGADDATARRDADARVGFALNATFGLPDRLPEARAARPAAELVVPAR